MERWAPVFRGAPGRSIDPLTNRFTFMIVRTAFFSAVFCFASPLSGFAQEGDAATEVAADAQALTIESLPGGMMKFKETELRAKAGQPISLTFNNPDILPHNLLVLKPGSRDKVGALADAMITDPNAMAKGYVPESEDIIKHTKLLNATQSETITFTLEEPGEYPIICTFPGHWRLMQSKIIVE